MISEQSVTKKLDQYSRSLRTGTEQPVLPANSEWSDCILAKIIG